MKKGIFLAFAVLVFLTAGGCVGGTYLKTQSIQNPGTLTGFYRLILFHDDSFYGLRTIAFLEAEGSGYSLEPYVDSYDLEVRSHVSGKVALEQALDFIKSQKGHHFYTNYQISEILSKEGKTIGYEVRPLCDSTTFGVDDVMTLTYTLKEDGIIKVNINLLDRVMKQLNSDG
ncbi:MAG TPA: hypothetical protein VEI28_07630 [Thermodesulfovibrionales bacterium]|nr:hypothetical protein [Thermodesulfovibrionales bacterium]